MKPADSDMMYPYSIVIYQWKDDSSKPEAFTVSKHGNRKCDDTPYIRTNPAVLRNIESSLKSGIAPQKAYDIMVDKEHPLTSSSQSNQARNLKQVQNLKINLSEGKKKRINKGRTIGSDRYPAKRR